MSDFSAVAALTSIIISLCGTGLYVRSILAGRTRPHLFTWAVWTILPAIGFFAQRHEDAGPASWTTGVLALSSLLIALLSLRYGSRDRTRTDRLAFAVSLTAVLPWVLTKDPLGSVILISLINLIAFYPTFRKSWDRPHEERLVSYGIGIAVMGLSLLATKEASLTALLYPAAFVASNAAFIGFCLWRRGQKKIAGGIKND